MEITPIKRFWRLLSQYKPELRQIYSYAVFNGIVNLSLPLGIQAIINYIQTGEMTSSWVILVCFVLVGIAVTGIFQVLQLRIVENIQQDIFARSAFEFAYRLPKIDFLYLDKIHTPELANRFFDTLTIQKGLPKILIDFSLASFQIITGLVLLAIYSPYFIILAVVLVILLWILYILTASKGLETSLKESKNKYKMAHWLEEIARVHVSFKLGGTGKLHLKTTDKIALNYVKTREKHFQVLLNQFRMFIGFKVILAAGLLLFGSLLVFEGQMDIGQFVAAEIIIILILNSVEKVIRVVDTIYDVLTALEKIGYVTDLKLDNESGHFELTDTEAISLEAIELNFSFPDGKNNILDNLSFKIPKRSRVIVQGKTGSGKSTLLKLLGGIHPPEDGELLVNDIPFGNYQKDKLYQKIGFAFPTNQLFEGTIRENITLGNDCEEQEILEILKVLRLDNFVAHQAEGIDTPIDSGGRRLPRSIIQKMHIARIILGKPQLLLLEDPLQFVANAEKERIIDFLMDEKRNWTVVVVADYFYWQEKSNQIIQL